jgi:teichoic acid transport system permease protein
MWLTPILWRVEMVPEQYRWVFKLNPVGYIVEGYRDAIFGRIWVWQHWATTLGFWAVTIALWAFARNVFRRTKPHFADVL